MQELLNVFEGKEKIITAQYLKNKEQQKLQQIEEKLNELQEQTRQI
jgi:hypothetical protein